MMEDAMETLAIFAAAAVVLAVLCIVHRIRRRKQAETTTMGMLAMSETPAVRASRNVC